MSRDSADQRDCAVVSRPMTVANDTVRNAVSEEEMRRWLQDTLEDDEVREALKSLRSSKRTP